MTPQCIHYTGKEYWHLQAAVCFIFYTLITKVSWIEWCCPGKTFFSNSFNEHTAFFRKNQGIYRGIHYTNPKSETAHISMIVFFFGKRHVISWTILENVARFYFIYSFCPYMYPKDNMRGNHWRSLCYKNIRKCKISRN